MKKGTLIALVLGVVLVTLIPLTIFFTKGEKQAEDMSAIMKMSMETAIAAITLGETMDPDMKFTPCMIATGAEAGLTIGIANIDAIEAEAAEPDGKLHLKGGSVDFTGCMDKPGKPDPWPPSVIDPEIERTIKTAVPAALNVAATLIESKLPDEGPECVKGKIALAMMDGLGNVVTTTVMDAAAGKTITEVPEFDVDYSGCGLDLTAEDEAATPDEVKEEPSEEATGEVPATEEAESAAPEDAEDAPAEGDAPAAEGEAPPIE